jgi:hypothetical protein
LGTLLGLCFGISVVVRCCRPVERPAATPPRDLRAEIPPRVPRDAAFQSDGWHGMCDGCREELDSVNRELPSCYNCGWQGCVRCRLFLKRTCGCNAPRSTPYPAGEGGVQLGAVVAPVGALFFIMFMNGISRGTASTMKTDSDDGTILLVIALVLTVIILMMIGACGGAFLLLKFFRSELIGKAEPVAAVKPSPAADPGPTAKRPPSVRITTTAVQTEKDESDSCPDESDDVDCPDAVRWVTATGAKYHRFICSGTNGYPTRPVTPCKVCAKMKQR